MVTDTETLTWTVHIQSYIGCLHQSPSGAQGSVLKRKRKDKIWRVWKTPRRLDPLEASSRIIRLAHIHTRRAWDMHTPCAGSSHAKFQRCPTFFWAPICDWLLLLPWARIHCIHLLASKQRRGKRTWGDLLLVWPPVSNPLHSPPPKLPISVCLESMPSHRDLRETRVIRFCGRGKLLSISLPSFGPCYIARSTSLHPSR